EILERTSAQLAEYFAGTRTTFDLPLDPPPPGTAFERGVWDALRAIPYGTTVSYGELARRLGDVRATRAVGAAYGENPVPVVVPPPRTACERRVGDARRAIPYGPTVSYGEPARRLGDVRAARAVGAANGKKPFPIIVPCHRDVGSRGELTGVGGGLERKRW